MNEFVKTTFNEDGTTICTPSFLNDFQDYCIENKEKVGILENTVNELSTDVSEIKTDVDNLKVSVNNKLSFVVAPADDPEDE